MIPITTNNNHGGAELEYNVAIKTVGLAKEFGPSFARVFAIADLNLEVPRNSVFGFLGPNGAGKTTTIRMIVGLIAPTSGSIQLFGQINGHSLHFLLRHVGYVPETPQLYPHLSAREN